jgi:hypothetical protein
MHLFLDQRRKAAGSVEMFDSALALDHLLVGGGAAEPEFQLMGEFEDDEVEYVS